MRTSVRRFALPVTLALGAGGAVATVAAAQEAGRTNATPTPIGTTTPRVLPLVAADLTGAKEAPGPGAAAPAAGQALVTIDPATKEVCINLATTGIGAYTGAHIHSGVAGVAGPVVIDFAPPSGTMNSYVKCVTDDDATGVAADPSSFYVNIHTADFPSGAVRDQLALRDSESQFLATPQRAYDSRQGTAGKITNSATRVIDLSAHGVPIGARAAIINLTATRSEGTGFLVAYSNALTALPSTSTINFFPTADIANETTVAVDGAGKIKVSVGPVGSTDFIVDVVGYVI
jgi:hypothetical protein